MTPVPVILSKIIFCDYSKIITNKKRFVFLSACFFLIFLLFNHNIIINVAHSVVPVIVLKAQRNGKEVFYFRNGGCWKLLARVFIKINCPIGGRCNKSFWFRHECKSHNHILMIFRDLFRGSRLVVNFNSLFSNIRQFRIGRLILMTPNFNFSSSASCNVLNMIFVFLWLFFVLCVRKLLWIKN